MFPLAGKGGKKHNDHGAGGKGVEFAVAPLRFAAVSTSLLRPLAQLWLPTAPACFYFLWRYHTSVLSATVSLRIRVCGMRVDDA